MGSLLTRLLWLCSAAGAVQLTERSWQQVAGKTVFVNFHAQWCSHCQALKPTWNKLANAQFRFQDARKEKAILIADVDCSGDAAKFCVDMGVDKFPTLKHGHPLDLDEYKGKKELRDLERFLQELQPVCTVEEQSFCSAAEKKLIKKFQKTSVPALEEVIEELAAEKRKVEAEYSLFKDNLLGTLTKDLFPSNSCSSCPRLVSRRTRMSALHPAKRRRRSKKTFASLWTDSPRSTTPKKRRRRLH
ncbi:unnamed protein product [Effrenium voratum]|nr:unnamed protein product [Effrenium voratum]